MNVKLILLLLAAVIAITIAKSLQQGQRVAGDKILYRRHVQVSTQKKTTIVLLFLYHSIMYFSILLFIIQSAQLVVYHPIVFTYSIVTHFFRLSSLSFHLLAEDSIIYH